MRAQTADGGGGGGLRQQHAGMIIVIVVVVVRRQRANVKLLLVSMCVRVCVRRASTDQNGLQIQRQVWLPFNFVSLSCLLGHRRGRERGRDKQIKSEKEQINLKGHRADIDRQAHTFHLERLDTAQTWRRRERETTQVLRRLFNCVGSKGRKSSTEK